MGHSNLAGTLLGGRYRLQRCIGAGGMGEVWEAWQEDLRRAVAVKVLTGHAVSADSVARFQREARAAAALGHPHIVQVYDFQTPPGEPPFLVMELLPHASLAEILQNEGAMRPERVARIARQVLDALAAAHAAGIIHRDIKPGNIAILRSATLGEIAKVLDFGVAKLTTASTGPMTTGGLVGTIAYMSPEQAAGGDIDGRSDIFSLAVCMYTAITLQRPFGQDAPEDTLRAILSGAYRRIATIRPDIDPRLCAIIEQGMAHSRQTRYQTALDMARDLDAWLSTVTGRPSFEPAPAPLPSHRPSSPGPTRRSAQSAPIDVTNGGLSPPTGDGTIRQRRSNIAAVMFGLVLGALILVGGVAFAFFLFIKSQREGPTTQVIAVPTPTPTPTATATPTPTSTPSPSSTSTTTTTTTTTKAAKPVAPVACAEHLTACNGKCVNLRFDRNNCGGCGVVCSKDTACLVAGVGNDLTAKCRKCSDFSGMAQCGDNCASLTTDRQNCGACNNVCGIGEMCQRGKCQSIAPPLK